MAAGFQAKLRDTKMALRRSAHMNDIRLHREELLQVIEILLDWRSRVKLARHERLAIADPHNLAAFNPLNLRCVVIGNLAASNNGSLQHLRSTNEESPICHLRCRDRLLGVALMLPP